jgi:hypothetical protein
MATYFKVALDGLWWLGLVSASLFALLFLWSLMAEPSALSAFALEIGLKGFNVERPVSGHNVAMVLPVDLEIEPASAASLSPPAADMRNIRADLRFPIHKGWFFSFSLTLVLGLLILGMWIADQLRQIFGTLRDGEPFAAANAGRIRRVAAGVILAELVRTGAVLYWSYSAGALVTASGARFIPATHISAPSILYGLLILVIAEIFREGARLREEQSLTI